MLHLAMIYLVEIIGEAAKHVDPKVRQAHPEVPWSEMIGMRNHITHGYYQIDNNTMWNVLTIDLPATVPLIEAILPELPEDCD